MDGRVEDTSRLFGKPYIVDGSRCCRDLAHRGCLLNRQARSDLATEAVDDFRRIVQMLRVSSRRAEREFGVSGAQLFVLQKLAQDPAGSVNELAGRTLTHQSSVSVVVRRLVERGLVQRERSPEDARRVELRLTPAGERLLRRSPAMPQIELVETVRELRSHDLRTLARVLRRLAEAIGAADLPPRMIGDDRRGVTRPRA